MGGYAGTGRRSLSKISGLPLQRCQEAPVAARGLGSDPAGWPSCLKRSRHSRPMRGQTPAASLAASGVCAATITLASRSRRTTSGAFSRMSIGLSQGSLTSRQHPGHPLESSQSAETCNSAASRGQDKSVHVGIESMVTRIGYGPVMQGEVGQDGILRL